jgi:hypothetical protein
LRSSRFGIVDARKEEGPPSNVPNTGRRTVDTLMMHDGRQSRLADGAVPPSPATPWTTIKTGVAIVTPGRFRTCPKLLTIMPLQFAQDPVSHIDAMRRMIHTYSVDMPHLAEGSGSSRTSRITPGGDVILLTGTTGALGSELLVDLLASERVSRVYAFNRPVRTDTIRERHQRTFEDRFVVAFPF